MSASKYDVTAITQLNDNLSTLIQEHNEQLEPQCVRARELLKEMANELYQLADAFTETRRLYTSHAEIQSSSIKDAKEGAPHLMLATLNKKLLSQLPVVAIQFKVTEQKLTTLSKEFQNFITCMTPLVDDYNNRLKGINENRPKGFFKPQAAAALKKNINTFCQQYIGRKGLLQLADDAIQLTNSFDRMKKMYFEIKKQTELFYLIVDKKVNPSAYTEGGPALLAPQKSATRRKKDPIEIEIIPTPSPSN